jgi:hypothetical protein
MSKEKRTFCSFKNQLNTTYAIDNDNAPTNSMSHLRSTARFSKENRQVFLPNDKNLNVLKEMHAKKIASRSNKNFQGSIFKKEYEKPQKTNCNYCNQPYYTNVYNNLNQPHPYYLNSASHGSNFQPCYIVLQPIYCDRAMARNASNYDLSSMNFQHYQYPPDSNQSNTRRIQNVYMYPSYVNRIY